MLIVDDETGFRQPINAFLTANGMQVKEAGTAAEMDAIFINFTPEIVLLDVNLPDETGLDIAYRLKQTRDIDIIMLSAFGDVGHRINGLTAGADYYLPKPVDLRELLAVILSRKDRRKKDKEHAALWILDVSMWLLTTPDGIRHKLTKNERSLLNVLISKAGHSVSRQQLYEALGVSEYQYENRSLDVQIARIRRRFTADSYTIPIKTVHNVGYLFNEKALIERRLPD
ncbi:response regulator transcription factor [uncultured Amphritea sp.]|uniref:response regulator transcription factor n=1 Tax=uncultured Amphritea sp. TaxID=981605 RepID=UPI00261F95A4|nr:response regulator transcription factor [uncultured Amphritea sp.]